MVEVDRSPVLVWEVVAPRVGLSRRIAEGVLNVLAAARAVEPS